MTPNEIKHLSLDIEPITLMWNGQAISLPGTYEPRRRGGVRSTARKQRSPMKMRERLCRWLVRVLMPGYYIARIGKRGKRIAESNGNLEGLC